MTETKGLRPEREQLGEHRPETILLVEDDAAVRRMCGMSLRSAGYAVLEAGSAEEAMHLIGECSDVLHLLLTDLNLPGAGGFTLSEAVRATRPGVRVLLITGGDHGLESTADAELAADAFLQKPFSMASMARQVRAVLDESESHTRRMTMES